MSVDDIEEVKGHYRGYLAERCFQMLVLKEGKMDLKGDPDKLIAQGNELALSALNYSNAFMRLCDEHPTLKPWERAGW